MGERRCGCGAVLSRYNTGVLCGACERALRDCPPGAHAGDGEHGVHGQTRPFSSAEFPAGTRNARGACREPRCDAEATITQWSNLTGWGGYCADHTGPTDEEWQRHRDEADRRAAVSRARVEELVDRYGCSETEARMVIADPAIESVLAAVYGSGSS